MKTYLEKKYIISGVVIFVGVVFILRLFYLQVIDSSSKLSANNNVLRYVTQYPSRGIIYDRKGVILVSNQAAYDLMIIPKQVTAFDTTEMCNLLDISKDYVQRRIKEAVNYSRYKPSVFLKQISIQMYGAFQERLHKFPGFFVQTRTLRHYPLNIAAHVLGYIGEVDETILKQNPSYKMGDYIGISGLEKSYENEIKGRKGVKIFMVDVHNRIKNSFDNGSHDTAAIEGLDLYTTLSASLQAYGEKLMANKRGSIVAIEPATGEILALVSAPIYDPNLLIGRVRAQNFWKLKKDSLDPLFNRAIQAKYSPGSIFKIVEALIGLQEQVISYNTAFPCDRSLVNCHNHPNASNLRQAIQFSCNPYFYNVYRRIIQQGIANNRFKDSEIGLQVWYNYCLRFGLGKKLGIDILGESSGRIPSVNFYNKWYGVGRWSFSTIYSNGIGQGEVEVVPLQMANLACIIANRGYYYTPHLVKSVGNKNIIPIKKIQKHTTGIDTAYYSYIIEAMMAVVEEAGGTAARARIKNITVCGKTGTAQNNKGEDHSVFIAFAPKENPKIAIAVYVENAGFGGTWAAPIASLMIEKYLTDSISDLEKEKRILEFKLK